ncbi:MAG TPA: AAA family ATPase, partial [Thermoanaerobaculia bacterium]|nr:AAA family ATPase [Thermoanaerobaculia bacterium]
KGLLNSLHGQACIRAWRDPNLMAVQIPGSVDDLPQDKKAIVTNRNADYRRTPSRDPDLAVAVVNADDVIGPDSLDELTATSYIKMSEISVEGLRQAFLDPGSRIRLGKDQPAEAEHSEILAVAWQGGFLDNVAIRLNENLNVLVGGRGTGKSTIVESIRYALGVAPRAEEARRAHESIIKNVVKAGTKISLLIRSRKPATVEYVVERTVPNPPIVRDSTGNVLPLSPSDIFPAVEVYGQHEISEIANSAERRTLLLSRFIARDPSSDHRKGELKRALNKSRSEIQAIAGEKERASERLSLLPRIEETLKAYQSAGLEQKLELQTLLIREERVFTLIPERLQGIREAVDQLTRELPLDTAFVGERALSGLPNHDILSELQGVFDDVSRRVELAATEVRSALAEAEMRVADSRLLWTERRKAVEEEYQRVLRELQKGKVNAEEFMQLRRQIEELRPLRDRMELLDRSAREQGTRRRNLLAEWEDVLRTEFQLLEKAAKKVSRQLRGRVRVRVISAGNRKPLEDFLRDNVGGRVADAITALNTMATLSLREIAEDCRTGKDTLIAKYHIPPAQAERICQMPEDAKMQLEELELPATTRIELNVAADGQPEEWKALDDLSTGQKATAILLLLLLESDAPLMVDQPEDDLDNRFISEGIVPKMREEKLRRQFIFATHNANIPVLGDAELILGLRAREDHGDIPPENVGSIDSRSVQKLVEETLEGGREAFEVRRLKYGF